MEPNDGQVSPIGRATTLGIAAVAEAQTIHSAMEAYWRIPLRRDTLAGMVAFAKWDGMALGLSTALLGLCGEEEFPSDSERAAALLHLLIAIADEEEAAGEKKENLLELWALLSAATSLEPAKIREEQMEFLSSVLSWAAPTGGEAEQYLAARFPKCLSLVSVFERMAEAVTAEIAHNPWEIVRDQNILIAALQLKIQRAKL